MRESTIDSKSSRISANIEEKIEINQEQLKLTDNYSNIDQIK